MSSEVSVSFFDSCSDGSWVKTTSGLAALGLLRQEQVDAGLQLVRDAAEGQAGLGRARGPAAAHRRADSSTTEHQTSPLSGSRTSSSVSRSPSSGARATLTGTSTSVSSPRSSVPAAASSAGSSSLAACASTSE